MLSLPCKMYGLEKEDGLGQKFPEKHWHLTVDQKKETCKADIYYSSFHCYLYTLWQEHSIHSKVNSRGPLSMSNSA